jgi:hypothetical protein
MGSQLKITELDRPVAVSVYKTSRYIQACLRATANTPEKLSGERVKGKQPP